MRLVPKQELDDSYPGYDRPGNVRLRDNKDRGEDDRGKRSRVKDY